MPDVKTIKELAKWDKNPRKITPQKARILLKTLKQFGDLSGIIYNTRNKSLGGGHQRQDALADAEIEIIERFKKPTEQGTTAYGFAVIHGEKFAYREVSWDEQTHAAAAIVANKGAGSWDMAMLPEILLSLDNGAFDMELTGHESDELETMMTGFKDISITDFPELPTSDRSDIGKKTFSLSADQLDQVDAAIEIAKKMGKFTDTGNENPNGNALARICEMFVTQNANY